MFRYKKKHFHWLLCWGSYLTVFFILGGCELIEYSPNQVTLSSHEQNLNAKSAEQIQALELKPTDTLRIALIADTQRYFDETEDFVTTVNALTAQKGKRIHFVLHAGDLTDFGLLDEYRWQHQILKKLKMPYLAVLGNHDCVANGKQVYRRMYGPYDQTYQFGRNRFVFLNSNSLEFKAAEGAPQLDYLEANLRDTHNYDNAFVLAHVPPYDADFDSQKEMAYAQLIRQYNVRYSLHGHQHTHRVRQPYRDGKNYIVIGSVANRRFLVLTIIGQEVKYEVVSY